MANKAIDKANLELALSENNKKIKEFVRNENLLINSYFLDPVNSSGQTEWTSIGVTVDTWAMENTRGSVSLTDEGLAVKYIGDDYFSVIHKIVNWEHLLDKTVTLSAKVNGAIYSKAFTINLTNNAIDTKELSIPGGYMDFYKQDNQDAIQVRYIMQTTPDTVVTFEWIKLELGSVATAFFPPNKEVEKLKCDKANAYTLNGSTIDDITGWVNNKLQYIQTTSYAVVKTAGWYRVAEYNSVTESVLRGSYGNACFLSLKRAYNHYGTEEYRIRLSSAYDSQTFKCEDATIGSKQLISKVRYTYDSEKAYIEIYYNEDLANPIFVEIGNSSDGYTCWKAIDFETTEETVEGVTVTTTYNIPASAKVITDAEPGNLLVADTSEKAIIYVDNVNGSNDNDGLSPEKPIKTIESDMFIKHPAWDVKEFVFMSDYTGNITIRENTIKLYSYDSANPVTIYGAVYCYNADSVGVYNINIKVTGSSEIGLLYNGSQGYVRNVKIEAAYIGFATQLSSVRIRSSTIQGTYIACMVTQASLAHVEETSTVSGGIGFYVNYGGICFVSQKVLDNSEATTMIERRIGKTDAGTVFISDVLQNDVDTVDGHHASDFLLLSGGGVVDGYVHVKYASAMPFRITNKMSDSPWSLMAFENTDIGDLGALGFKGENNPVFYKNGLGVFPLHHDGNSAKIYQGTSAPTDTTCVWVDTANKCIKSYIDGAWQQVS